ncbi:MAG: SHOCT domain-containing protein [Chloroflexota bacterium]
MAKYGIVLGCVLMLLAFVALSVLVILPVLPFGEQNTFLLSVQGVLLCHPGEKFTLTGQDYSDFRGSARVFESACVSENGEPRNVDDARIPIALVSFLVPFLIGLFMVMIGSAAVTQRRVKAMLSGSSFKMPAKAMTDFNISEDGVMNIGGVQIKLDKAMRGTPQVIRTADFMASGGDLTEKLQQIHDALAKGLITQQEYDQMRQRILDESV